MEKAIAENRKARFDYEIAESLEAGLALSGPEVKAIRAGKVNLSGSYGRILWKGGQAEVWLVGAHIGILEGDATRSRKLLLHRNEINRLLGKVQEKGLTLIPLRLYFKGNYLKMELGLGRGRKKYEKRERIKEREWRHEQKSSMNK